MVFLSMALFRVEAKLLVTSGEQQIKTEGGQRPLQENNK